MTAPRWRLVMAGVVVLVLLAEAGVRQAGLADFPIYRRSDSFGYVPMAAQSGRFMNSNRWAFNERSQGVDRPWKPGAGLDILLVGNSIVMGGNPYDQQDKVTPKLQARLGAACPVWPVAAGGWSTVNEMRFLDANPELVDTADFFIWEFMPDQMGGARAWSSESMHPTQRPFWATGYVLRKALEQRFAAAAAVAEPSAAAIDEHYRQYDAMLGRLAKASGRSPAGIVFAYPDRWQLARARAGSEWLSDRARLESLTRAHRLVLVDVAKDPRWTESMYRDGVHPTVEGNALLAQVLAEAVRTSIPVSGCTAGHR